MKIVIGSDKMGYGLKEAVKAMLTEQGHEVMDVGTTDIEQPKPHTVTAPAAAKAIQTGEAERGILICGTGVGISLAANKVKGIRACVCSEPYSAKLSKQHNNSNMIAFGARVIGIETAKMIVDEWLNASYEGERHQIRVDMIAEIEETGHLAAAEE